MKLILCVCILILSCSRSLSQAPPWLWAKDASSTGPELAWDVSCDKATGNVYVAGSFNGNLSAFYGAALSAATGPLDGFVAKYSSNGSVIWAFKISGPDVEEVKSVATDPFGNIYVTGYFKNTVDFDPSAASYTLSPSGSGTNQNGFLAKYTSAGALLWAAKFGDTQPAEGWRVFADSNYVYLTGNYTSSATFYSTNSVTKSTAAGQSQFNMFGAKYDASGVVQWVVSGGSVKDDIGYNVIADYNKVYMIGTCQHDLSVYDASGSQVTTVQINNPNKTDVYILAFQQSGAFAWAANVASNDDDFGSGLTQDGSNLYVAGSIKNTASFPYPSPVFTKACQGGMDIFLAKLSKSSGTFQWVSSQTGSGNNNEVGYQLDIGLNNRIIMSGYFDNNLNYTSYGGPTLNTSGNEDIFVSAYDNAGNFAWAVKAGANGKDEPYGLTTDTAGGIYIAGEHAQNTAFGSIVITSAGGPNIFVAKMGCNDITNNTATASQTICAGNAPSSLSGSLPAGGNAPYSYIWQQSSNGTSWSSATGTYTNQNYAPPPLSSPTYYRRIAVSGNLCGNSSTSASILISVDAQPTPANAGADQSICATTATMSANTPVSGTGTWNLLSGSGAIVSNSSPGSAITGLGQGNNKFTWTISNGVCPASKDTVTILRYAPPTNANAGSNQVICAPSSTLSANSAVTGSGNWTVINGTGTVSAVSSPSATAGNLSTGANTFVWTISNGVCPASTDTVIITRDALPTPADAGTDQVLCAAGSTLNANFPTTGSGLWTVIAGTGTVTTTTSPTTPVGNLGIGTNKFVWTISNGSCPASRDTVVVTRDAAPSTANAGTSQTVCAQGYTLSANAPAIGSANWTVLSGGGTISNASLPSTSVSNLSPGANAFVWTISNGVCPASTDTVVITRDALPTQANAGADQVICGPATAFTANTPGTGAGLWALISGSGTATLPAAANSPVSGLGAGTNLFTWTISNGSCPPSKDTVRITSYALPSTAIAGQDQTICASNGSLTANTPMAGTGLWIVTAGTAIINNPTLASTGISGLSAGNNAFAWIISNGICPASSDTVIVRRDLPPTTAVAGSDQSICADNTTLDGNSPITGTGNWTLISGSGSFANSSSPAAQVTGLAPGNAVFAWTISSGVCQASQDTVTVHADASPGTANAGGDQAICNNATVLSAMPPPAGSGTWSLVSGAGNISNLNSANSAVTGLPVGTAVFRWTVSNGVCPSSSDDISVQRDTMPSQAQAGPDQDLEIPAGHLAAVAPAVGNGSWSLVSGSGNLDNPSDPAASFYDLAVGSNIFRWTISNGACPASMDEVTVYLEPFKIPNAFSPNGDNINDAFVVPGIDYYNGVKFSVFNRWGGLVFENDNYKNDWGGTNKSNEQLAEDTYYYILDVRPKMSYSGYVIIKRNK